MLNWEAAAYQSYEADGGKGCLCTLDELFGADFLTAWKQRRDTLAATEVVALVNEDRAARLLEWPAQTPNWNRCSCRTNRFWRVLRPTRKALQPGFMMPR
jgi:hypothetical protein